MATKRRRSKATSPLSVTAQRHHLRPRAMTFTFAHLASAADAGTCWPSTPGSLLCVDDPWNMRLHRVTYGGQLPHVQPPAIQEPFAMVLDDGTRCRPRSGGAWGGRDDGYVGTYGCGAANSNLAVLWLPSQGPGSCIDRSAPLWTVKVGQLVTPSAPPQTHPVTTAWFAGDFGPA